jgi:hypothetical protein
VQGNGTVSLRDVPASPRGPSMSPPQHFSHYSQHSGYAASIGAAEVPVVPNSPGPGQHANGGYTAPPPVAPVEYVDPFVAALRSALEGGVNSVPGSPRAPTSPHPTGHSSYAPATAVSEARGANGADGVPAVGLVMESASPRGAPRPIAEATEEPSLDSDGYEAGGESELDSFGSSDGLPAARRVGPVAEGVEGGAQGSGGGANVRVPRGRAGAGWAAAARMCPRILPCAAWGVDCLESRGPQWEGLLLGKGLSPVLRVTAVAPCSPLAGPCRGGGGRAHELVPRQPRLPPPAAAGRARHARHAARLSRSRITPWPLRHARRGAGLAGAGHTRRQPQPALVYARAQAGAPVDAAQNLPDLCAGALRARPFVLPLRLPACAVAV